MEKPIATFDSAGATLAYEFFSPTVKLAGEKTALLADDVLRRLERIYIATTDKLEMLGKQEGSIPLRVLKEVFEQGSVCEDQFQTEYLGGILASSMSVISRDDRGASYLALIKALSSYQIRTHFILYSSILRVESTAFGRMIQWLWRGDSAATTAA